MVLLCVPRMVQGFLSVVSDSLGGPQVRHLNLAVAALLMVGSAKLKTLATAVGRLGRHRTSLGHLFLAGVLAGGRCSGNGGDDDSQIDEMTKSAFCLRVRLVVVTVEMPNKPTIDVVPNVLRAILHWVCWKYIERSGKRTKCPVNAVHGWNASSTDPNSWCTFNEAVAALGRGESVHRRDPMTYRIEFRQVSHIRLTVAMT